MVPSAGFEPAASRFITPGALPTELQGHVFDLRDPTLSDVPAVVIAEFLGDLLLQTDSESDVLLGLDCIQPALAGLTSTQSAPRDEGDPLGLVLAGRPADVLSQGPAERQAEELPVSDDPVRLVARATVDATGNACSCQTPSFALIAASRPFSSSCPVPQSKWMMLCLSSRALIPSSISLASSRL